MKIIVYNTTILPNEKTIMVDNEDLQGLYDFHSAIKQVEILNSLNYKGFDDWRLPDREELNKLYKNKDVIGGFASAYYWSSTEYSNYFAWNQNFGNGYQGGYNKSCNHRVRCVREF